MTLKVPDTLRRGVKEEARRRGVSASVVIRDCLESMLRRKRGQKRVSCYDLAADLAGSQPGPPDASVNRSYLEDAVVADHNRARKNSH